MSGELLEVNPPAARTPERVSQAIWANWSDWVGMVASIGCAIHCAAMPFVIAYLPALGLSFLADEAFHKWTAVGCFVIAMTAFVPGLRNHGRLTPVIMGGVGLSMISIAAFGLAGECCSACASNVEPVTCCPLCATAGPAAVSQSVSIAQPTSTAFPTQSPALGQFVSRIARWLTPVGGIVLVGAHLLNRRYGCLCGCCEHGSTAGIA